MPKATILCVDDELNGLIGREVLLRQHGYNVVMTTSGRESLELLQSVSVDAVILDYLMPEMMGDVVAAHIKQLKPDLPIMLLSAHDRIPPTALRWTDTFVSKSVPPDQFLIAVHELLAIRSPFFHRWLQNWKRRLSA
jgi:two-component system, NtrC family, nitrogen regulation response regulator NtrX